MKINEVFSPLREEAYDDRPSSELQQLVKKYHTQILDAMNAPTIYRGMKFTSDVIVADGAQVNRKSKNTRNYYTLVVDNEPAWEAYPKRSKSFICSTDFSISTAFGNIYVVVPLENQNIGVCSNDDFWESFQDFRPAYLNTAIWEIQRHFDLDISETNFDEMKKGMQALGKLIEDADLNGKDNDIAQFCHRIHRLGYEDGKDFYSWYASLFDPERNGFTLTNKVDELPRGREIWMSGKVLLIDYRLTWDKVEEMVANLTAE